MADPSFYRKDGREIVATRAELETIENDLAAAFERWEALEALAG
jgi:ATP-binding cassette subfamily F protein uup